MNAEFDPIVAEALQLIAPQVESDPDALLRRAREVHVHRHVLRIAALAFAGLALLAGGALAATKLDLLPWFQTNDRGSAAFSIDSTRTYAGPAPLVLECPQAGGGEFDCTVGSFPPRGPRTYSFTSRVEAQPRISRAFFLAQIDRAEQNGLSAAEAARFRHDIGAVGDDFFAALGRLNVETVGSGEAVPGRPGYELVPPQGVPMWASCIQSETGVHCHDLAFSHDIAVGTPIYRLNPSGDWVAEPQSSAPPDLATLFHALLGRDLKPAEIQFLRDLLEVSSGSAGVETGPTETVTTP